MTRNARTLTFPALAVAAALALPVAGFAPPAFADCPPGTQIDDSTADWARDQFRQAGYEDVAELEKGCDNYWHGVAMTGDQQQRVVVSPDGEVMKEGGEGPPPRSRVIDGPEM
jgi:hypothetical protein